MSFEMTKKCTPVKCSHVAKAVLMWLAHHHNSDSGRCDPSSALLAEESCLTPRSVVRALKELKEAGHIHFDSTPGKRNAFTLNPRLMVTSDSQSPVTNSHMSSDSQSHGVVTNSPKVVTNSHTNSKEQEDEQEIKSKQEKTSKRKMNEDDFRQACSVELDFTASQKLKAAWSQWQLYRVKTNSGKRPWTEQAANIAKKNLQAWAEKHGDEAVIAKVEYAISSTHQTFFEPTPPIQFNRNQKPQPTRYTGAGI